MLSQQKFHAIASAIAPTIPRVVNYSITEYQIDLTVHSRVKGLNVVFMFGVLVGSWRESRGCYGGCGINGEGR